MPQSQKAGNLFMKKQSAKSAKLVSVMAIFCLALAWVAASARATAIAHQFVPAKSSLAPTTTGLTRIPPTPASAWNFNCRWIG